MTDQLWLLLTFTTLPPLSINPDIDELRSSTEYGNDHVTNLAEQFQGIVGDSLECVEEWSSFKQYLKDNCSHLKQADIIHKLIALSTQSSKEFIIQ